jgi:hypothetical protein
MTIAPGIPQFSSSDKLASSWYRYFECLRQHVSDTYKVSSDDSQKALTALLAFFQLKRAHHKEIFILPQIVDWMWHEFILDTKRYTDFCETYFGYYLHHVKARHSQQACTFLDYRFRMTQSLLNDFVKVDCESPFWSEAGWNSPEYRLRNRVVFNQRVQISNDTYICPSVAALDLEWLTQRLAERYGVSVKQANFASREYQSYLSRRTQGNNNEAPSASCDTAWKEHVLSTVKYHRDCNYLFGAYLHRSESKEVVHADA